MSSKPTSFAFFPKDFVGDALVMRMAKAEQVGAYFLLLCSAWQQDPPASLPNDDRVLSETARMTPDEWSESKPVVLAPFTLGKDNRWHQKRLRREYVRAVKAELDARMLADAPSIDKHPASIAKHRPKHQQASPQASVVDGDDPAAQRRRERAKAGAAARWKRKVDAEIAEYADAQDCLEQESQASLSIESSIAKHPQASAKEEGGKGGDVSSSEKSNPPKSEENQKPNPPKVPPCDTAAVVDPAATTTAKGKGRRKRGEPSYDDPRFVQFWAAYPKRESKTAAARAMEKLNPSPELMTVILAAIDRHKRLPKWRENGGQFIPFPATWLNGKRWEDEVGPPNLFVGVTDDDDPVTAGRKAAEAIKAAAAAEPFAPIILKPRQEVFTDAAP